MKLFETIAVYIQGGKLNIANADYHQHRVNLSCTKLGWAKYDLTELENQIYINNFNKSLNYFLTDDLYRLKLIYDSTGYSLEQLVQYQTQKISSFYLIDIDFDYSLKRCDRSNIDQIIRSLKAEQEAIFIKDGLVTDTSIANLIFFDGFSWFTPRSYLLLGTMRQSLIDNDLIQEKEIRKEDIVNYSHFMTINALNPFSLDRAIPISQIKNLIF